MVPWHSDLVHKTFKHEISEWQPMTIIDGVFAPFLKRNRFFKEDFSVNIHVFFHVELRHEINNETCDRERKGLIVKEKTLVPEGVTNKFISFDSF